MLEEKDLTLFAKKKGGEGKHAFVQGPSSDVPGVRCLIQLSLWEKKRHGKNMGWYDGACLPFLLTRKFRAEILLRSCRRSLDVIFLRSVDEGISSVLIPGWVLRPWVCIDPLSASLSSDSSSEGRDSSLDLLSSGVAIKCFVDSSKRAKVASISSRESLPVKS